MQHISELQILAGLVGKVNLGGSPVMDDAAEQD
ncbi:hypothetical protein ARSEF4850_004102 [Beauveria asiatica]